MNHKINQSLQRADSNCGQDTSSIWLFGLQLIDINLSLHLKHNKAKYKVWLDENTIRLDPLLYPSLETILSENFLTREEALSEGQLYESPY